MPILLSDINEIADIFAEYAVELYAPADLEGIPTPRDDREDDFPRAISFAIPMNPEIMAEISRGPTARYAAEYSRINEIIDSLSERVAETIRGMGYRGKALAASKRTDTVNIRGDFPHKTAATLAGIGWIGRNCQLITRKYGPWVRLGTILTDLNVRTGNMMTQSICGKCSECADHCPAGALSGNSWYPGIPRELILDVKACDNWKKNNYLQLKNGHVCGICSSVCPYGRKNIPKKDAVDPSS